MVAKLRARVCARDVGFVCGDGTYCASLLMVTRYDERRKMSRLFAKGEKIEKCGKKSNKIRQSLLVYIARSTQSSATEKVKKKRTGDERI